MVVERGLARCPRCVTVADYVFIESESGMRYEVHCRKCGQSYGEKSLPWAPPPRSGNEPSMQWPPDSDAPPSPDWRTLIRRRISVSAQRTRAGIDIAGTIVGSHARAAIDRARTRVRDRRMAEEKDQTGG